MDRAPGHTTAVIPAWEKEEGQTRPSRKNTRSPGSAPSREEAPRLGPFSARSLLLLLLSALFPVSISAQPSSLSTLEEDVRAVLDTVEGDFAVAFRSLDDTSQTLLINEHQMFHAASTMKTPVMIELYRQAKGDRKSVV